MKKNFLYSMMAMVAMTFASCSQEEVVSTATNGQAAGPITVSVNMPQEGVSRAMPMIDGYTRRCVMQVVDAAGEPITGTDLVQRKEVTGDNVQFTFTAPEVEYNVLFWADYVPETGNIETDYLYTTESIPEGEEVEVTDLTNITQKMSRYYMFQDYADAFSGCMKGGETSITLTRPFSRLEITSEAAAYAGYDQIQISNIAVPDGYNVFDKTTSTTKNVRLADAETGSNPVAMRDAENGIWAYLYVFAPVDAEAQSLSLSITLHDSTGSLEDEHITASSSEAFAWDENMHIYFDVPEGGSTPGGDTEVTVDVNFGEGFENDPVAPTIQVGAYVDAAGEPVATAAEAVGIVFAMGAIGDDVPANYPEALQGKTIKAYAVALENMSASRQQLNAEAIAAGLTEAAPTNGTENTDAFLAQIDGSAFDEAYTSWIAENTTSGENVSSWYIPALPQLQQFINMFYTIGETAATGSEAFRGMSEFANDKMFDRDPIATIYYASCTVNDQGNPSGVRINVTEGAVTNAQAAGLNVKTAVQSALCRPMFTIFE